ncbi:MAG TPA: hypothetical protein VHQ04_05545 [Puia sp.]|nr:hypothetical protein [Puia sp.]
MKTKIPILIAAGLFLVSVTKAQYGASCNENRVVIQAHFGFPVPVPVVNHYEYYPAGREHYDDRRDWRAEQYERYCHENRGYRMSRDEFYRDRCDSRNHAYYAPQKRVEYRRY